jgi:hypothetical protein
MAYIFVWHVLRGKQIEEGMKEFFYEGVRWRVRVWNLNWMKKN